MRAVSLSKRPNPPKLRDVYKLPEKLAVHEYFFLGGGGWLAAAQFENKLPEKLGVYEFWGLGTAALPAPAPLAFTPVGKYEV